MLSSKQCLSAANWNRNMKLNISLKSKSLSMQNAESYMWNTSTTHISRFQYQREFFTFLIKKHAFVIIFQAQLILLSSSSLCLCAFFSLNSSVLGGRQKENLLCRYSNIHKKIINFLFCSIGRKFCDAAACLSWSKGVVDDGGSLICDLRSLVLPRATIEKPAKPTRIEELC